ncbi:hypothetical protein [Enterobacter mori]|uniref:hypothetical protein n=1 Tax=Enterobacter mori TaxID=539813 RepID=UPI001BFC89C6|nr:hypothetical protein [Enterobacter mori]MBW8246142.1 hypothetical protein [Enterobacter mori]MBW8250457.1 hypothetical protein [Enterobacter mori]QWC65217.1 hypothetical protein JY395_12550 [Enterobacter mori]
MKTALVLKAKDTIHLGKRGAFTAGASGAEAALALDGKRWNAKRMQTHASDACRA